MRPYRQDRLARARRAMMPERLHPALRAVLMILLGLLWGVPWWILIHAADIIRMILVRLYRMGEKTWTSMLIVVNDPDAS